jgi:hypothetical protein
MGLTFFGLHYHLVLIKERRPFIRFVDELRELLNAAAIEFDE